MKCSVAQFSPLIGVSFRIMFRNRRAAPLDIKIIQKQNDGFRSKFCVKTVKELSQTLQGNMG